MSHLISFVGTDAPPPQAVAAELQAIVAEWSGSVAVHLGTHDLASSPLRLKREPVVLAPHEGTHFRVVRHRERLGELLNVLASVVRTADELTYLADAVGGAVTACNPTTSNVGHDVEVLADDGAQWVVEVSDVVGSGNANGKMTKDLTTLSTAPADAGLLLACSPSSAAWLTSPRTSTLARLGLSCTPIATVGNDADVATHIVEVHRRQDVDS